MSLGDLEMTKSTQAAAFILRLNVTIHRMMNGKKLEICLFREDTMSPQLIKVKTLYGYAIFLLTVLNHLLLILNAKS